MNEPKSVPVGLSRSRHQEKTVNTPVKAQRSPGGVPLSKICAAQANVTLFPDDNRVGKEVI